MHRVCLDEPSLAPSALPVTLYKQRNTLEVKSLFTFFKYSIYVQSTKAQEKPQVAHQTAVTHLLALILEEQQKLAE